MFGRSYVLFTYPKIVAILVLLGCSKNDSENSAQQQKEAAVVVNQPLKLEEIQIGMSYDDVKERLASSYDGSTLEKVNGRKFGQLNQNIQEISEIPVDWWDIPSELSIEFGEKSGKVIGIEWSPYVMLTDSDVRALVEKLNGEHQIGKYVPKTHYGIVQHYWLKDSISYSLDRILGMQIIEAGNDLDNLRQTR